MIKIPCLFERDFSDKRKPKLLRTVTPGCEWVLEGDGAATRKRDGTSCLVKDGKLFKRYDVKTSKGNSPPPGAIACTPSADPVTGHWPHWVEVTGAPDEKWHMDAWLGFRTEFLGPGEEPAQCRNKNVLGGGTYELCGPKINGNPEKLSSHVFFKHGLEEVALTHGRDWDAIQKFLEA